MCRYAESAGPQAVQPPVQCLQSVAREWGRGLTKREAVQEIPRGRIVADPDFGAAAHTFPAAK